MRTAQVVLGTPLDCHGAVSAVGVANDFSIPKQLHSQTTMLAYLY